MSFLSRGGEPFTVAWARYSESSPTATDATAKIWVSVRHPEHSDVPKFLAEVDTGAPWTLLDSGLLEALGLLDEVGEPAKTLTARGTLSGQLIRTPLVLVPAEGPEVRVETTILVSKDWPGPNLLGMTAFLERIRFAIDPFEQEFHFGTPDAA